MARKVRILLILTILAAFLLAAAYYFTLPFGFAREVSQAEQKLRLSYVRMAEGYLGCNEEDGSHKQIVDRYNSHQPLAQDYVVTYEDSWCSVFVSAMAIEYGITGILPTECGCERHIELFREMGRWEESDTYIPLPGDLIFYDWNEKGLGDSQGWADHVGIVVGTRWPVIKVIEGNLNDSVSYNYVLMGHPQIRGFGLPDYAGLIG